MPGLPALNSSQIGCFAAAALCPDLPQILSCPTLINRPLLLPASSAHALYFYPDLDAATNCVAQVLFSFFLLNLESGISYSFFFLGGTVTSSSSDSDPLPATSLLGDLEVSGLLVADSCSMFTTSSLATSELAAESSTAPGPKDHRHMKEQDWQRKLEVAEESYRSRVSLATKNYSKVFDNSYS